MNQIASMSRPKFLPDNFTLTLIGTLVVASLLPCRGAAAANARINACRRSRHIRDIEDFKMKSYNFARAFQAALQSSKRSGSRQTAPSMMSRALVV
jgi:hypothetical protein